MATPAMEQSTHMGTTKITANGIDQLSYNAASTRNTKITEKANTIMPVLPDICSKYASSVHSTDIDWGNFAPLRLRRRRSPGPC